MLDKGWFQKYSKSFYWATQAIAGKNTVFSQIDEAFSYTTSFLQFALLAYFIVAVKRIVYDIQETERRYTIDKEAV